MAGNWTCEARDFSVAPVVLHGVVHFATKHCQTSRRVWRCSLVVSSGGCNHLGYALTSAKRSVSFKQVVQPNVRLDCWALSSQRTILYFCTCTNTYKTLRSCNSTQSGCFIC